jgi:hypothetical protein
MVDDDTLISVGATRTVDGGTKTIDGDTSTTNGTTLTVGGNTLMVNGGTWAIDSGILMVDGDTSMINDGTRAVDDGTMMGHDQHRLVPLLAWLGSVITSMTQWWHHTMIITDSAMPSLTWLDRIITRPISTFPFC